MPRTTLKKASTLLMGLEQVKKPKPCKLYDDDDDMSTYSTFLVFFLWGVGGRVPPHNLNSKRSITKVKIIRNIIGNMYNE
jgi:hypothetical protein